jgi:hypothetical protein
MLAAAYTLEADRFRAARAVGRRPTQSYGQSELGRPAPSYAHAELARPAPSYVHAELARPTPSYEQSELGRPAPSHVHSKLGRPAPSHVHSELGDDEHTEVVMRDGETKRIPGRYRDYLMIAIISVNIAAFGVVLLGAFAQP